MKSIPWFKNRKASCKNHFTKDAYAEMQKRIWDTDGREPLEPF